MAQKPEEVAVAVVQHLYPESPTAIGLTQIDRDRLAITAHLLSDAPARVNIHNHNATIRGLAA
jgi:hypothetical protein